MWIRASTTVFTASDPFGACPSVCTVTGAMPRSDTVLDAWPVTIPVVDDANVTEQCPVASVPLVQVYIDTFAAAPLAFASVTVTGAPAAAIQPLPSPRFFSTKTLNVCGSPMRLSPEGVMWIRASTNRLTASGPFWPCPSVCTVIGVAVPRSERVLEASPVTVPGVGDVNVTEQCPVASVLLVQVFVDALAAAPFVFVNVAVTDSFAAGTKPAPPPRSFSTKTSNVCGWPARFVPDGEMWIRASTNVFTASGLFSPWPFVATVNGAEPATANTAAACPVTRPVELEVKTIVH